MKKNKIYRPVLLLFLVVIAFTGMTGCSGSKSGAYSYEIYYTDSEGNSLSSLTYKTDQTDKLELVKELMNHMNTDRKKDNVSVIKKDGVTIENYALSNNTAYIYFNKEFNNMSNSLKAIYRCAVVKTLTQIDEVEYVTFFVDNIPAAFSHGTAMGMMSGADFVEDSDTEVNNLQWSELNLYFANDKGDRLVKDKVSVTYSRTMSIERVIVEELIKGPDDLGNRTIPENLKVLNVSVKDGICYVNLDNTFLTEMVNVSTSIPIYSIVNSLCELDSVDSVQILINGESKKKFRESISLDAPFTANYEIVSQ